MHSGSSTRPHGPRRFRAPVFLFLLAFALRVLGIAIAHSYRVRVIDDHFDFGYEAGRIARSLVTGHGYGNPFNGYSGPTAWLPPLFPLLLAGCFKLFGVYSRGAAFAILTLDSLFSALIVPAIYEIAARCLDAQGLARRRSTGVAPVALWCAAFWAVYPAAMQYAIHWIWEMSLSTCLFTWAFVMALRLRRIGDEPALEEGGTRWGLWALLGVLWGAIALSNASLLLMLPATLVWVLWPRLGRLRERRWDRGLQQALGGAVLTCLIFAAIQVPWVVRNERVMHRLILTRDNFGVEFWQSSRFAMWGPLPWGTAMPLSSHEPEFQRYVREGEYQFAQQNGQLAIKNVRRQPWLFAKYTLERMQFFWFATPHSPEMGWWREYLRVLQYSIGSLAGLLGVGLMLRRRVPGALLMAMAFLLVPLVYYAVTVQPRFRHPLEPLLMICAVYLFRCTQSAGGGD